MNQNLSERLATHIKADPKVQRLLQAPQDPIAHGGHMGAILVDATLHSTGLKYSTVVEPKVKKNLKTDCRTVSAVRDFVGNKSPGRMEKARSLLHWKDPKRFHQFLALLDAIPNGVETAEQLCHWLQKDGGIAQMIAIKGFDKTSKDYLPMMCGANIATIDTRLQKYIESATGKFFHDTDKAQELMRQAAEILSVKPPALDSAIWRSFEKDESP